MVGKPALARFDLLDWEREASMADEGGRSGAEFDSQEGQIAQMPKREQPPSLPAPKPKWIFSVSVLTLLAAIAFWAHENTRANDRSPTRKPASKRK
jgi:hypothetical protein